MRSIPRLSWLGAKQMKQSGDSRKNRSGHLPEHTESIGEHGSRIFAAEVDKILNPPAPVIEPATTPAPEIGEVTRA